MYVSEVMSSRPECTRPDATLREAAQRMRDLDVGALPVCDNDHLVGVITDRDITVRSVSDGHDPRTDRVRDIMTPDVSWCFEDQDVDQAAQVMREKQIRRLPVLSRAKRLVGIVSLGDLAIQTGDEHLAGQTLEAISQPPMAEPAPGPM